MRKLIISTIVVLSMFGTSLYGQKNRVRDFDYFPKNEFYLQYGAPTVLELTTLLGKPAISNNVEGKADNHTFTGVGGLGYNYSIDELISLGFYTGVSSSSADVIALNSTDPTIPNNVALYNSKVTAYTFMLSAGWNYFQIGALSLSSGLYLGLSYRDETISSKYSGDFVRNEKDVFKFAYHLSAIKARYGETIGAFAEIGFGFRGLLNIGLSIEL